MDSSSYGQMIEKNLYINFGGSEYKRITQWDISYGDKTIDLLFPYVAGLY